MNVGGKSGEGLNRLWQDRACERRLPGQEAYDDVVAPDAAQVLRDRRLRKQRRDQREEPEQRPQR
jgi:hypothetical protein